MSKVHCSEPPLKYSYSTGGEGGEGGGGGGGGRGGGGGEGGEGGGGGGGGWLHLCVCLFFFFGWSSICADDYII